MGKYPGFPPDANQVEQEQHGMTSRHNRMMRFEAINVRMWVSLVLALLIALGILIAVVLGVRIDMILGGM